MAARGEIVRLLNNLASNDETKFKESSQTARYLIEKSTVRYRHPDQASKFYQEALGDEYSRLVLTDREIDALVDALLARLEEAPQLAAAAAAALAPSQRLSALPKLSQAVERWARIDGWATRQAIIAIEDIVTSTEPLGPELNEPVARYIDQAIRAMEFAANCAVETVDGARRAAEQARVSLSPHSRRS